jgi:hypothetical protein
MRDPEEIEAIVGVLRAMNAACADLASFARQDAVETIINNWQDALHTGHDLAALIIDIDDTIAELAPYRANVCAHFGLVRKEGVA